MTNSHHLILIHGFGAKRWMMSLLARRITKCGFQTSRWGYFSFAGSVTRHSNRFHEYLSTLNSESFSIVAHSMGSVIARHVLSQDSGLHVKRLVMIAPPNHGSPVATIACPLLGRWLPFVSELSTRPDSFVNRIDPVSNVEIGVLTAQFDWIAPKRGGDIPEQKESCCLAATHNSLLVQKNAAKLVCNFLQHGQFGEPHQG